LPKLPKGVLDHVVCIGIDPGKKGGIAAVYTRLSRVLALPMPETEADIWRIVSDLYNPSYRENGLECHCVIEKVHSMPQQGIASAFTFGWGYGGLRMALIACGIPFREIDPKVWQKDLGISRRKEEADRDWKKRLRGKAQQLFPGLPIWKEPRSEGRQLAISDALLIADYCRRINGG
jgi:hypothetical protein